MLARVLPFALYVLFLALGDAGLGEGDQRWLYPAKAIFVASALVYFWSRYSELKNPPLLREVGVAVGAGLVVFALWVTLDASWMTLGERGVGYDPRLPSGEMDVVLVAFRLFGAALVVPIMEELFWRSYLLRWLKNPEFLTVDPRACGVTWLFVTSLLFAVEHHEWFAGLVAGAVYGALYMWSRNLWVPVIGHAVTNGVLGGYVILRQDWGFW